MLRPGQEIILAETGHEANLGCWKRLERQGVVIRWWRVDTETYTCPLEGLRGLLSERTALVALPHVSNLLGGIVDLPAVVQAAHAVGARVVARRRGMRRTAPSTSTPGRGLLRVLD
ncbi:MAG: aminotransferase class V-fold PLP-dependent enzyme, partial [bacterium]|nr:aminotransferase class V-fold PLP-dependent enzyme [bacterium]